MQGFGPSGNAPIERRKPTLGSPLAVRMPTLPMWVMVEFEIPLLAEAGWQGVVSNYLQHFYLTLNYPPGIIRLPLTGYSLGLGVSSRLV